MLIVNMLIFNGVYKKTRTIDSRARAVLPIDRATVLQTAPNSHARTICTQ